MTGYTSGRLVTHDPQPWELYLHNLDMTLRYAYRPDDIWESCETLTYAPRSEFDNHNPILAAFRRDYENRLGWWTAEHHIETWLGPLGLAAESGEYPTYSTIWEIKQAASADQIEHARRVLTKLAALRGE